MAFADLKNDFVFRRIFASHPHLLCALLNDLLDRRGDQIIEAIEYLPLGKPPPILGARLSILNARCKERSGSTFIVAIQLIHFLRLHPARRLQRLQLRSRKAPGPRPVHPA